MFKNLPEPDKRFLREKSTTNEGTIGLQQPVAKSIVTINGSLVFTFTDDMPNWWHRMFYRLLLGWKWTKVG